ncbi:MAG TPA: hypothetical protein VHO06_08840 [Polyangia bacterium]|nr:hypothetical protein [Polyangia bacterium]
MAAEPDAPSEGSAPTEENAAPADEAAPPAEEQPSAPIKKARKPAPAPEEPPTAQPTSTKDTSGEKPTPEPPGWHTDVTGYFRTPISLGISSRPGPDNPTGPSSTQVSYGPNRTIDSNYYAFSYTRLQEQDWAEVFIHEKKKHVDAAVGWMGYWYQSAGFRNPDAAWAPGLAYITLDTDFRLSEENPERGTGSSPSDNVAFTVGAWWPKFGYFEKYDTYTLGRFRQLGEQLKLTFPLNPDWTVVGVEGFGTDRDGSFNFGSPPFYSATVGLDLLTWWNLQVVYGKYFDIGLHYNTEWTADPNLEQQGMVGPKSYQAASQAHLTVAGGELNVRLPYAGHLWLSPSYISVRNGWALSSAGTEVMHALGGAGIATNYMAWTGSPADSTGTGSMINFGFLYENTLSGVQGRAPYSTLPELTLSIFGLYADSRLDLPAGTMLTQENGAPLTQIRQFKYGADLTLQTLTWLSFMVRGDVVDYDMDHSGFIFASATGRVQFASHFLSSERIYIQYSRYKYGDRMTINGDWPWDVGGYPANQPLVAGSNVTQQGPYSGMTPDKNVIKLQAEIAF